MTVTVPTVLLVFLLFLFFCWGWWVLTEKVVAWAMPRYLRWYWGRLGGEGEPPVEE